MDSDNSSKSSSSTGHSAPRRVAPSLSSPTSSQASLSYSSPNGTQKRRAGRKKFRETRHPVYRGVRERNGGKWVCEVREPQKKNRIWLGTYAAPEMAARAHDVAVLALRGKLAPLNFPDSAWAIPHARSAAVEDIRSAAAKAAEMFRPAWAAASTSSVSPRPRHHPSLRSRMPSAAVQETDEGGRVEPAAGTQEATAAAELPFLDEEALFNMPGLLASMAEGMLLTPPATQGWGFDLDDVDGYVDTSLWRH